MFDYTFHSSTGPELEELHRLPGSEWCGPISPTHFGKVHAEKQMHFASVYTRGFFIRSGDGTLVSTVTVLDYPAMAKKGNDKVVESHCLLISYVFTHPAHRRKGLAQSLIQHALTETEKTIEQENPNSSEAKLSTKFYFVLHSAIGEYYDRFGFRSYPLKFYSVPLNLSFSETSVHWLTAGSEIDQELIDEIYKTKKSSIEKEFESTSNLNSTSFAFTPCVSARYPHTIVEQDLASTRPSQFAKYFKIQGAVVESDNRYYACLWNTIMSQSVYIRDFAELSPKAIKILSDNSVIVPSVSDSISTLLRAGSYITRQRHPSVEGIYVATSDLPVGAEKVLKKIDRKVRYVDDLNAPLPNVLPMLRRFHGENNPVRWVQNGMWCWD